MDPAPCVPQGSALLTCVRSSPTRACSRLKAPASPPAAGLLSLLLVMPCAEDRWECCIESSPSDSVSPASALSTSVSFRRSSKEAMASSRSLAQMTKPQSRLHVRTPQQQYPCKRQPARTLNTTRTRFGWSKQQRECLSESNAELGCWQVDSSNIISWLGCPMGSALLKPLCCLLSGYGAQSHVLVDVSFPSCMYAENPAVVTHSRKHLCSGYLYCFRKTSICVSCSSG